MMGECEFLSKYAGWVKGFLGIGCEISCEVGCFGINNNKKGKPSGSDSHDVVGEFDLSQRWVSLFGFVTGKAAQHVSKCDVPNLGLAICLGVVRAVELESGLEFMPKSLPDVAHEFDVSVRSDCLLDSMKPNYFPEKQISNMDSINNFFTRNEVSHFGEPINHNKEWIKLLLGAGEAENEVHG